MILTSLSSRELCNEKYDIFDYINLICVLVYECMCGPPPQPPSSLSVFLFFCFSLLFRPLFYRGRHIFID